MSRMIRQQRTLRVCSGLDWVYIPPHDGDGANQLVAEIISRLHDIDDDGHAIKLARAAVICQELSRKHEDREWIKLKGTSYGERCSICLWILFWLPGRPLCE
jgi:hypothetical protein